MVDFTGLPGADRIERGLAELGAGIDGIDALLVAIGAPRLVRCGVEVPARANEIVDAELRLYALLGKEGALDPYSRYNALLRELVSFERALEQRVRAARRRHAKP
jgi:hypothetical protein